MEMTEILNQKCGAEFLSKRYATLRVYLSVLRGKGLRCSFYRGDRREMQRIGPRRFQANATRPSASNLRVLRGKSLLLLFSAEVAEKCNA